MDFEWNCGCLHLPQSALFNAVSAFGIPRGDTKFTRDFGTGVPKLRGCQNHCDTALSKILISLKCCDKEHAMRSEERLLAAPTKLRKI